MTSELTIDWSDMTEEQWKEKATQKSLDIVESFYNILKYRDAEIVRKDKALLLAARWFKLNFDDDTLNEHPPSKADLAGMFDAMQEARSEYSAPSAKE